MMQGLGVFRDPSAILEYQYYFSSVSILDPRFGAHVDGVTDDTNAWIAAHNALPSTGGKIVMPIGVSVISSLVTFTKPVIIHGVMQTYANNLGSIISLKNSGGLVFQGDGSGTVDVNIVGQSGATGNGVNFQCGRPFARNLDVIGAGGHGIVMGSDTVTGNYNCFYFSNIKSRQNGGHGLYIAHPSSSSPDTNAGVIVGAALENNSGDALHILNGADNTYIGLMIEGNKGPSSVGINCVNTGGNLFLNPYIEGDSTGNEIQFDANSSENRVLGMRAGYFAYSKISDSGTANIILATERNKGEFPVFQGEVYFDKTGVSNHSATGWWTFAQDATTGKVTLQMSGATENNDIDFTATDGTTKTFHADKVIIGGGSSIVQVNYNQPLLNAFTIPANSTVDQTVNITGVKAGNSILVCPYTALPAGVMVNAYTLSAGVVTLRFANVTTASINIPSTQFSLTPFRME